MLVLTRKASQRIIVRTAQGAQIEIAVLGFTEYGQVRIGVEAPKDMTVHREEVQERIDAEVALAAKFASVTR